MGAGDNARDKIIQGEARLAELDLAIEKLQARKEVIKRYVSKLKSENAQLRIPTTEAVEEVSYSNEFEDLWKLYSAKTGRQVEKKAAFRIFKKIKPSEHSFLKKAISNYGDSRQSKEGFGVYMKRFLKEDFWPAWINAKPQDNVNEKISAKDIAREVLSGKK